MKTIKTLTTLILLVALTVSCSNKNDNRQFNSFRIDDLPQLSVGDTLQGVSAPFAGMIGSELIVAGGCNFPDVPAADGGEKRFYADVYGLDVRKDEIEFRPLLRQGTDSLKYTVDLGDAVLHISVHGTDGCFRAGESTEYYASSAGKTESFSGIMKRPHDGEWNIDIRL